jgi:hypothetical protein
LIEALDRPGCPVCRLVAEAVDAYLGAVCYEQVNDLDVREQLRAAGGFCRAHAYRFLHQRHGKLASAIVYRDVLANAARRIERGGTGGRRGSGSLLSGLLGSKGARRSAADGARRCLACQARDEAEERYLGSLRSRVVDPAVQERYRAADGLCVPHLDRALEADDEGARILAASAVAAIGTLVEELDEFIRKHDYRFRPEVWEGGEDTPERAIERAVGRQEPRSAATEVRSQEPGG